MNNEWQLFYVAVLIVLSNDADGFGNMSFDEVKEHCRFKGDMCEVNDSCFKKLRENHVMENCDELQNSPKMSLFVEQALSFEPNPVDKSFKMHENFTYSVYMSNDFLQDDVHLVTGCCNLDNRNNDTCLLPAVSDPDIRFFVVFPYNKQQKSLYCLNEIAYDNRPLEFCVEGEEVIDPCLEATDDGDFIIRYRYTPLSPERKHEIETNRCYFPLPAEVMPQNKTYPPLKFVINEMGFIIMKPPDSALVRNVTEHDCTIHMNVNKSDHFEIATNMYNAQRAQFVCCGLLKFEKTDKYFRDTYCTNMQPVGRNILPIVLPIVTFVALLALIACVKVCHRRGKFKKMADDWKKSPSSRFLMRQQYEGQEKMDTAANTDPAPKAEEFFEIVPELEGVTADATAPAPELSEQVIKDKEHIDHSQDESKLRETRSGVGVYTLKHTEKKEMDESSQSDDSGFCHSSGSNLGQYCMKSSNENRSDPICPDRPASSGYLAKTVTIDSPYLRKDFHTAKNTVQLDEEKNSGDFNGGYTPKYITKHDTPSSEE